MKAPPLPKFLRPSPAAPRREERRRQRRTARDVAPRRAHAPRTTPSRGPPRSSAGSTSAPAPARSCAASSTARSQGHQLVLHARLGHDVRLPLAGGHRRLPGDVLRARLGSRAYASASHITNDVFLGEFVRGMHKLGLVGDDHPDLPAHGQDLLLRRVQVPARAELGHRRGAARAHADDGPHRLPAAVRPALLLGHGRGREHQRVGPDDRPLPGGLPESRRRVRAHHDHAASTRSTCWPCRA